MLRKIRTLSTSQLKTERAEGKARRRRSLANEDNDRSPGDADVGRLKMIRATVDAAFEPMFSIDEQGIIIMANDAASKTFGWTFEDFMGSNISLICTAEHAKKHDSYIQRYIATGVKKMIGAQREVTARRRDGSEFPVELGISEIRLEGEKDGNSDHERYFCAYTRDLTAEKMREQEIEMKQSLVQGMIDSSFDPMFGISQTGIINVVNQAAVAMFGFSRDEFLGKNVSMICGGEHGPRHDEYIHRYLLTGEKRIIGRKRQVPAKRKDGSEFLIELGITEVKHPQSGERQFCGFCRDITKSLEDMKIMRHQECCMTDKFFDISSTPPRKNSYLGVSSPGKKSVCLTPPPSPPSDTKKHTQAMAKVQQLAYDCITENTSDPASTPPSSKFFLTSPPSPLVCPLGSPSSVIPQPPLTPRGNRRQKSVSLGKHSAKSAFMITDHEMLEQKQP
uniref:PAS domain-containing protein n=1 Tax=Odontella aurita TaxID=265563 RepID=A0A7S4JYS2_9STRA|mmetsp:Transcript_57464/g.171439  ORF Transcript_57464/g.171439 Transcript_57464/m.171439 type:complete len:449 (+) Transcript_57464:12-1358(+)